MTINLFSKKYGNIEFIIDDEDFDLVSKYKLRYSKSNKDRFGYIKARIGSKECGLLHNIIMNNKFIDHIDGNSLNNQKKNLRPADYFINNANANIRKDNTIGHKGIRKTGNKYIARIQYKGNRKSLGSFYSLIDAINAYNTEFKKLHKIEVRNER